MSMSRKHFEAIAATMNTYMNADPTTRARRMADVLAEFNPNFDRKRFLFAALNEGRERTIEEDR